VTTIASNGRNNRPQAREPNVSFTQALLGGLAMVLFVVGGTLWLGWLA
jgi:hypothetical protein